MRFRIGFMTFVLLIIPFVALGHPWSFDAASHGLVGAVREVITIERGYTIKFGQPELSSYGTGYAIFYTNNIFIERRGYSIERGEVGYSGHTVYMDYLKNVLGKVVTIKQSTGYGGNEQAKLDNKTLFQYKQAQLVNQVVVYNSEGSVTNIKRYTYDQAGKILDQIVIDKKESEMITNRFVYHYDVAGKLKSIVTKRRVYGGTYYYPQTRTSDSNAFIITDTQTFDSKARIVSDVTSLAIDFEYANTKIKEINRRAYILSAIKELQNTCRAKKTTYSYNKNGQLERMTFSGWTENVNKDIDQQYSYEYDPQGNWIKRTTLEWGPDELGKRALMPKSITIRTITYAKPGVASAPVVSHRKIATEDAIRKMVADYMSKLPAHDKAAFNIELQMYLSEH